ncbi:sphingosine 1-phosphate receptor 1 [Corythoichthys intestinalis]|uniref:sphingosine 1-phosphate receptor 1 n=1 Tax=Corythoichthys intestinalis TaxID=161448 RepID=UPI0025A590AE|nr:sphingosine 1-phosphate receptor 1 [Corythoichthys intestinalis]XP_061790267.1 sphingosine 1-phosphate receptor 1-like [Nerophis lumbriciformis]
MADPAHSDLIARHYNYTGKLRKWDGSGLKADSAVFLAVCCLIVLENLLVLATIWRTKKFHKPMFYFLGNLALSDLLAGVVYAANILLSGANTYRLTPTQWFLREGSVFVALAASVFSLLAIAVERHLTMLKMKVHDGGRAGRVFPLLSAVWMVAALLGGLPLMGWNCIGRLERCSTVLPLYHKTYILFCTTVFSVILMAIVALYARIYALVRARSRRLVPREGGAKSCERSMALLKTVVVVLSCFIACWAPLFVLLLLDAACRTHGCAILYRAQWFLALAVLNSATNPLIYTLTSEEMRRAFLETLLCGSDRLRVSARAAAAEFSRGRSENSSRPEGEESRGSSPPAMAPPSC